MEPGPDAITEGIGIIHNLSKEYSGPWFDKLWTPCFLGSQYPQNLELFQGIHSLMIKPYIHPTSKDDMRLLLGFADLLADLTWRGIPGIQQLALQGDSQSKAPGLIQLAALLPSRSRLASLVGKEDHGLWQVRYHAIEHLRALCHHNQPNVGDLVRNCLLTRKAMEKDSHITPLFEHLFEGNKEEYRSFFDSETPILYSTREQQEHLEARQKELEDRLQHQAERQEDARAFEALSQKQEKILSALQIPNPDLTQAKQLYEGWEKLLSDLPSRMDLSSLQSQQEQLTALLAKQDTSESSLSALHKEMEMVSTNLQKAFQSMQLKEKSQLTYFQKELKEIRMLLTKVPPQPLVNQWPESGELLFNYIPDHLKGLYANFYKRQYSKSENAESIAQGCLYYTPLQASKSLNEEIPLPLEEEVEAFLASIEPLLLIQGDAGAGKSLFMHLLERHFWEQDSESIPFLIDLKIEQEPTEDLVATTLTSYGYNPQQIEHLREHHAFLFLLDGYDEMGRALKDRPIHELIPTNKWKGKIIVSCRTQYLGGDYWRRFAPPQSRNQLLPIVASKNERFITSLTSEWVKRYVEQRNVEKEYAQALSRFPELERIVTTPFLLRLVIEVLPTLLNQNEEGLTRKDVYKAFTNQWFHRELLRLEERKVNLPENPKEAFQLFSERLAFTMFMQNSQTATQKGPWAEFFASTDPLILQARIACPLRQVGNGYAFFHKSFMEYFAACYFARALGFTEDPQDTALQSHLEKALFNDLGHAFNTPRESISPAGALLHAEPAILDFLVPWIKGESLFQNRLLNLVKASKGNPSLATASANALTLLNWARVPLAGLDLRGIHAPYAYLKKALMHHTDLTEANFQGVCLKNAQLVGVSFQKANLEEIELGQKPSLIARSEVLSIACHPKSDEVAVGLANGNIEIWDKSKSKQLFTLTGHAGLVWSIAYSPDGEEILSGSIDKTVRRWSRKTGKSIGSPLTGHKGDVTSVTYSPDGEEILSGSKDKTVRRWSRETSLPLGDPLTGHKDEVTSVTYSPDGEEILSGSKDYTIERWSRKTSKPIEGYYPLGGHHTHFVLCVAYSQDGKEFLSGSKDDTIKRWSRETGLPIGDPLTGHKDEVTSVTYSPDGEEILSGSKDYTIRRWSRKTGKPIGDPLTGHKSRVYSVAYSSDGEEILSGSWDKTVRRWSRKTDMPIGGLLTGKCIAYSSDGEEILSRSEDNTVRRWSRKTGKPIGDPLTGHKDEVTSVTYSPDGEEILSGSRDNTVRRWSRETGLPIGDPLTGHKDEVTSVTYSPDGEEILSGSKDYTIRRWSRKTGKPIGDPLTGHKSRVYSVAYSPDGKEILSGSWDKTIRRWSRETGLPIGNPLTGHTSEVYSVTYSPDGKEILSGGRYETFKRWSRKTGKPIGGPLTGHTGRVLSATYSPDGEEILSGSEDNTVRLWNRKTGKCLHILNGHNGEVTSISWSSKDTIITGSYDRTIAVWKLLPTSKGSAQWCLFQQSEGNIDLIAKGAVLEKTKISYENALLLQQKGASGPTANKECTIQ